MPRFRRIVFDKDGDQIFDCAYDEDHLRDVFPEVRQAIAEDASCCGAMVIDPSGEKSLIVDRERWIEHE